MKTKQRKRIMFNEILTSYGGKWCWGYEESEITFYINLN
jgi:hypothetical protein